MKITDQKIISMIENYNKMNGNQVVEIFDCMKKLSDLLFSAYSKVTADLKEVRFDKTMKQFTASVAGEELIRLKRQISDKSYVFEKMPKIKEDVSIAHVFLLTHCFKKIKEEYQKKQLKVNSKKIDQNKPTHELSKESILIERDGSVSLYGLIKGFIQKKELILEEEKQIAPGIFQSKKVVSVALLYENKNFIVYYVNDVTGRRLCREIEDLEEAKRKYNVFANEMNKKDWMSIYWSVNHSYLN